MGVKIAFFCPVVDVILISLIDGPLVTPPYEDEQVDYEVFRCFLMFQQRSVCIVIVAHCRPILEDQLPEWRFGQRAFPYAADSFDTRITTRVCRDRLEVVHDIVAKPADRSRYFREGSDIFGEDSQAGRGGLPQIRAEHEGGGRMVREVV